MITLINNNTSVKVHKSIIQNEACIDNNIIDMFGRSKGSMKQEEEIQECIDQYINDFFRCEHVNSNISIKSLKDNFSDSTIPNGMADIANYLQNINENIIKHSVHTESSKFIGHMTTALPNFTRPLAKLMTAMNQNVVKMETSKAVSICERQVLAMMHRLVYNNSREFYDDHIQNNNSTLGIITSGGTIANITALWSARNTCLGYKTGFQGVEREGLQAALDFYGYKDCVVIGPSTMHYSFDKAVGVLGIGEKNLIKIKVDSQNHMDIPALTKTIDECRRTERCIIALIGVAGTTNSGSIDPLQKIGKIAARENIHFHVDAAWGGPLLFSHKYSNKLKGIELADTVTIDGHKQLYLPVGNGMVLMHDPHSLKAIEKKASYIIREHSMDLGRRSLEGSRPASVLYIHAALNIIGRNAYETLLNEGINKVNYAAKVINEKEHFQLLAEPEINILIYRYIPLNLREHIAKDNLTITMEEQINKENEQLQKIQRKNGSTFVSRTKITMTKDGEDTSIVALRMVIANPLTTINDINTVLYDQIKIGESMYYSSSQ